jgi:CheY-like chemotaxis protein
LDNEGTGFQPKEKALRILVVDDNKDAADSLCILLRAWGYDCLAVYDGAAGFQVACNYRPNCLLLDIGMPGLNGYTFGRMARAQPSLERAKLIALTAYSDEMHIHLAQQAGFDYHFVKPTDPLEIKRLMDELSKVV